MFPRNRGPRGEDGGHILEQAYQYQVHETETGTGRPTLPYTKWFLSSHVTYHVPPHQPIIDQQGLGFRGLVQKKPIRLFLTFTDICLKAFMLRASTALSSSGFHLLILFEKIPRNIPCAPNLFKFTRVPSCTFAVCIHLKQFLQCDRAISTRHFKNLYNILSISTLF